MKLTKLHIVAISLACVVCVLILLLLTKLARNRISRKSYRRFLKNKNIVLIQHEQSHLKQVVPVLPSFPYEELIIVSEEYVQPQVFSDQVQVTEEDDPERSHDIIAGTIDLVIRYDLTRSDLIVVLSKGNFLTFPSEEKPNLNYYITTKLFPQKHKSFQTSVHKTTAPVLNETFYFHVSLEHLFLQSLKFSLWSFDHFSHHDIIADGLLRLSGLEKNGLSICREVLVSQKLYLVPKATNTCGEIFLSLGYLALTQKLAVIVIQVTNLPKVGEKLPDPCVEVTLIQGNKKTKTKSTSVKLKRQHAKYNETLTFDVAAEDLHETSLLCSVISRGDGVVLGRVSLGPEASGGNFDHWDDVRTGSKPNARWHKLR